MESQMPDAESAVVTGFHCRQLTVVGLGLMGGSLALALRPHAGVVVGVEVDASARQLALERNIVHEATADLREGVADADVVVLAAPVRSIIDMLEQRLGTYMRSNTLLLDLGSTKQSINRAMRELPIGILAVGGHPMTGRESSGAGDSDPDMFRNRPFVLCPNRRTTPSALLRARALVEALGAHPIEMDAERHDRVVAAISHLPYLLSTALVATVANEGENDEAVWDLAAGGFRDMSRLAGSDVRMMGDILSTNTQAVATLLAMFRMQLAQLEAMLISRDDQRLTATLRPISESRREWTAGNGARHAQP
ncbi:MAG: prephenate dehydrogenase/arogenate dehydrogenase family protein [Anaerolineaceae bacterium]|nr:prephenate dehydrogenase/arogenate dehydrogenase family protein [Anaerolineaceae bacterium]